jgi:hypothetical protein
MSVARFGRLFARIRVAKGSDATAGMDLTLFLIVRLLGEILRNDFGYFPD